MDTFVVWHFEFLRIITAFQRSAHSTVCKNGFYDPPDAHQSGNSDTADVMHDSIKDASQNDYSNN